MAGAPSKYSPVIVRELIAAFNNGFSELEACDYAGISRDTLWRWKEKHPTLSDQIDIAKRSPNRKAKEVVIDAINKGDTNMAFRWLERRDPDFKPTADMNLNHGLQETRKKIEEFLDDTDDGAYDEASGKPVAADDTKAADQIPPTAEDIS